MWAKLRSYQSEPGKMSFQVLEVFRLSDFRCWKIHWGKTGLWDIEEHKGVLGIPWLKRRVLTISNTLKFQYVETHET